jgi:hypothetical protein
MTGLIGTTESAETTNAPEVAPASRHMGVHTRGSINAIWEALFTQP